MSTLDNLIEVARTTLVQAEGASKPLETCNSYTCWGYHSWHHTTLVHAWGIDGLTTLLLVNATTLDTRQSPTTLDNLFHRQADSKFWGLMYYSGSTKYMCQATWHSYTHVIPPCRPWHMSTDVMPLTVRLSPNRLSLTTSLFEYVVTSLSHGRYSNICKLHIICKLVIILKGCYITVTAPTNMDP